MHSMTLCTVYLLAHVVASQVQGQSDMPISADRNAPTVRDSFDTLIPKTIAMLPADIESILVIQRKSTFTNARRGHTVVETQIVNGTPVLVKIDEHGIATPLTSGPFEDVAIARSRDVLASIDHGRFAYKWLRPERLIGTISAARGFRDTATRWGTHYDGCIFLHFAEPLVPTAIRSLDGMAERITNDGKTILKVSTERVWGNRTLDVYLYEITPKLLLTTTDLVLMKELTLDHSSEVPMSRWSRELREFKDIDPSSTIWGIRRYRPESRASSFTSLLRVDPNAVGVALSYKPEKDGGLVATRFLSSADAAATAVQRLYPQGKTTVGPIISKAAQHVDVSFRLGHKSDLWIAYFEMIAPLGYSTCYDN